MLFHKIDTINFCLFYVFGRLCAQGTDDPIRTTVFDDATTQNRNSHGFSPVTE